jgi:hypothetical protein
VTPNNEMRLTGSVGGLTAGGCLGSALAIVHAVLSISAWQPLGFSAPWLHLTSRIALILALAGCLLLFVPALLLLCFSATRGRGVPLLNGLLPAGLGATFALYADHGLQARGEAIVVQRGIPIAEAIAKYEADTGKTPIGLHQLVPKYLDSIPATGFVALPRFEYQTNTRTGRWRLLARVEEIPPHYLCFEPRGPLGAPLRAHASAWVREVDDGCVPGAVPHEF